MNALTELLKDFLRQFTPRPSVTEYRRLMLGGLPVEVLEELYVALTYGDGSPWQPREGIQIPVFLVTRDPETDEAGPSRKCNWDYALAIRNSFSSFLLLVEPLVWDDRTYSIINATDTIGFPLPPIGRSVPTLRNWSGFYANVAEMAAKKIGFEPSIVESAIRQILRDLPSLDPEQQQLLPWQIVDRIASLSNAEQFPTSNDLAKVCGLLPYNGDSHDFGHSRTTVKKLAEFLNKTGIEDGIEELKATSRGNDLVPELEDFSNHLRGTAGSSSAFVRAPSYYSSHDSDSSWKDILTVEAIDDMLAEVGHSAEDDQILVSCICPLNSSPPPGEPFLFQEKVGIEAKYPGGDFQSLRILRRLGRRAPTVLTSPAECPSPFIHEDVAIPAHSAPLTYSAEAQGATSASVQVISLENYDPGGFVSCPGPLTQRVSKPRKTREQKQWRQEIFLGSGGLQKLRVFCGSRVSRVIITEPTEYHVDCTVNEGVANLQVDLDDDVEVELDLIDSNDQLVSAITLAIAIDQDQGDTVPSQFHALVQAHQNITNTISVARSKESWLRRAESELLNRDSSWRPILATSGWAELKPQLNGNRLLGKLLPQVDPRPDVNPPSDFIEARENVVSWLCSSPVSIPEADLANEEASQLAVDYLRAYREWYEIAPAQACWVDTVSILEPESEQYGGQAIAASEPIAVLISPLHPIRLGWHAAAQRVLSAGLNDPCPLAGLLDPHRCPEVLSLALARSGGEPTWKSFISISCQDAMWGFYWNSGRLRAMPQHEVVRELDKAGVDPRGVQSGFTASQAEKTLEEVSHVLPTRAILRIGIVGANQGATSCTEGLITWSRKSYNNENEGLAGPRSIEVYDSRQPNAQPISEVFLYLEFGG